MTDSPWEMTYEYWNPDLARWEKDFCIAMNDEDRQKAIKEWRENRMIGEISVQGMMERRTHLDTFIKRLRGI